MTKHTGKENVELYSVSYWNDWQVIDENQVVIKSFMTENTATDFCGLINQGLDEQTCLKETKQKGINRLKQYGLNDQQAEKEFNRREWRFD